MPTEIIGTPFFTPGELEYNMIALNTEMLTLEEEINNSGVNDEFKGYYKNFLDEWDKFYESVKASTVLKVLNSTYDRVEEFKKRFRVWQENFSKSTGKSSVTYNFKPEEKPPAKIPTWGWLIAAALGGFGLIKFMSLRTKTIGAKANLIRAKSGKPKSHKKGQY